ncbi:sulfhydryl oxidase 2-like [Dreissena polymorpha]|uniref:sulfhydryl oxidase 2-like n=1 Tax=Dreissena polymorpha TaxID=45954 RepID=UPI002264DD0E|nr:sulfhydryl oxidase 2-like [Dreissena polymorpha]
MCTRTMKQTNKMLNTLLITFLFYKAVFSKSVKGLYGKNDNVFILNSSNFDRNVVGSKSIWVVEFYNSWCGHCISFAPTWKEFAAEKIDWWPVVQIGAVNCAAEENTNLCRQYDVRGFPVFKLFAPMHKENSTVETFYEQNKSEIETKIVDFLSSESVLAPDDWPRLSPIKSMEHIWDEAKDEHHHVAFVFEDEQSNIGTQVILDTLKYRPLLVRRMLHGAVEKFGVTTIPALFLINRDGTFTNLAKTDNSRESMVKALTGLLSPAQLESGKKSVEARKAFLQKELLNILGNDEDSPDTNENLEDQKKPAVYMRDLESTLYYAFRQEIPLCQQISDVRLAALKTFVAALVQYFPGERELEGFLEILWAWLQTVKSGITGEDWLNKIDQLQVQLSLAL